MKAQIKATIAMLCGASALAVTVGFGGFGVSPVGSAPTTTTHPSSNATLARAGAAAPAAGTGAHIATLAGCISGLDC